MSPSGDEAGAGASPLRRLGAPADNQPNDQSRASIEGRRRVFSRRHPRM
ncbi:hypothetical protein HMPREF1980_00359 [Actinomyces sp. oral taxon 172 str. F0311]|nr:hypothetical protein HMPREF1980_00359 [Actinomyces sp. oral taxon 172 str. F0311]